MRSNLPPGVTNSMLERQVSGPRINGRTFEQWMNAVDKLLIEATGLGSDDLPDQCYMDLFESEVSPEDAVMEDILPALQEDF